LGLVCLAAFFVVWALRATVLYGIDEALASGVPRSLYSTVVKAVIWVAPAVLYAKYVRRENAWRYLGISRGASAREWGMAALFAGVYLGAVVLLEVSLGGKVLQPTVPTLVAGLFLVSSCFIEEVLFRGAVLHGFAEHMRGWYANLITSVLFVGVHWPYWLWSRGLSGGVVADSVGVFLVSLLFGVLFLRTRSIWPCVVAHGANNVVAGWLVG